MTEEQTKRYLAAIESIAASLKLIERPVLDACMITLHPPVKALENTAPAWVMERALAEASLCLCKTCIAHRARLWGAA